MSQYTTYYSSIAPSARLPRSSGGGKKGGGGAGDMFLVSSAEGRLQLVGRAGRMEKPVEAHRGAVLAARWSGDGAGIVTGGEDGAVRVLSTLGSGV